MKINIDFKNVQHFLTSILVSDVKVSEEDSQYQGRLLYVI